jgi:cytochrome c oxidase subunit II
MRKPCIFTCLGLFLVASIPGCSRPPAATEHIRVVMKKYEIQPAIIKVKSGDTVELEVSTLDVQHGLDIPQLNIKVPVPPGKPALITFKAPEKGEYQIRCGIICGPHHDDMQAKLVVE